MAKNTGYRTPLAAAGLHVLRSEQLYLRPSREYSPKQPADLVSTTKKNDPPCLGLVVTLLCTEQTLFFQQIALLRSRDVTYRARAQYITYIHTFKQCSINGYKQPYDKGEFRLQRFIKRVG